MFDSLISKTFAILTLQFIVTLASTVFTLGCFRKWYRLGKFRIRARKNKAGELDLQLNFKKIEAVFWILLVIDIAVFLALYLVGRENPSAGIAIFCAWSVITGLELALCLLSVDENLGARVLEITTCIVAGTALIGMYSNIDFMALGPILFWGLVVLIGGNLVRLFIAIPTATQRIMTFFGCVLFACYLIFDFYRLAQLDKYKEYNTWPVAIDFAIDIYLDVINLLLNVLDALSD